MLHVTLLILKILGIILLIIVGLLLLILWSVLFVAASYRIRIEKHGALRVSACAGWLFRIITVRFSLDSADNWKRRLQLRLFGFPIWDPYAEKKPEKRKRRRRKRRKEGNLSPSDAQMQSTEGQASDAEDRISDHDGKALPDQTLSESDRPLFLPRPVTDTGNGQESRSGAGGNKPSLLKKICFFFRKVIYAIKGICDKIKHIKEKILGIGDTIREWSGRKDSFLEFWNLEEHRRARGSVLKEIQYLWKKYRPKRIEGKIHFGFEDPSITGLCMGGIGMLCAWYPDRLQIVPDFEQEILEGDVLIKGKVRFYVLACILWRVYFNRDIRHMYEHWKQL